MTLCVDRLSFSFNGRPTLADVSLEVEAGTLMALVGPNGAGKTTLLRFVLALPGFQSWSVSLGGRPVMEMTARERARALAYVPQTVPSDFPMTVFEFVLSGRRPHLSWRPSSTDEAAAVSALADLGLEPLSQHGFGQLSGGQRQKALLARALAQDTPFLVLDEPTSSLDLRHQLETMELLRRLAREQGRGILVAVHELNLADRFADAVALLVQGRLAALGPPGQVLTPESIAAAYGVQCISLPHAQGRFLAHLHSIQQEPER